MRREAVTRAVVATLLLLAAGLAGAPGASASTPAAAGTGRLVALTPGLKGFDSLSVETPAQIACLRAAGYSFDVVNTNGDTWQDEYDAATAAGLSVVLFQGYYQPSWTDPGQGTTRATIAVAKAQAAGYPAGGQILLNLENNLNAGAATAIQWVRNWAAVVRQGGYVPGVYVGVPQVLTASQLGQLGPLVFWRSASSSAPQAAAGFVLRQTAVSVPACGITGGIDTDVAGTDALGGQAVGVALPPVRAVPTEAGAFVPVGPSRLLDTRSGAAVPANGTVKLVVAGRGGVPLGAGAAVLNVTVTGPAASGYITAYPWGEGRPTASTLNFPVGRTVANLVTVPLGTDGAVALTNTSAGSTQLLADVQGYYLGGAPGAPGAFVALSPTRLLDSRPGSVLPNGTATLAVTGGAGLPAQVGAVVLNVTVTHPTASGYITVFPNGTAVPRASNLNYATGQTVANLVTVRPGADGRVALRNTSAGLVQIIVDVQGYYRPGPATAPGTFVPLDPTRVLDTRPAAVPSGSALALRLAGSVPAGGASAVVANLTVTQPQGSGYLTAFPTGLTRPIASNLNYAAGQTVPNLATVPVGRDDAVVLFNGSGGTSQMVVDLAGYFVG